MQLQSLHAELEAARAHLATPTETATVEVADPVLPGPTEHAAVDMVADEETAAAPQPSA
jgi:hypothetical protein